MQRVRILCDRSDSNDPSACGSNLQIRQKKLRLLPHAQAGPCKRRQDLGFAVNCELTTENSASREPPVTNHGSLPLPYCIFLRVLYAVPANSLIFFVFPAPCRNTPAGAVHSNHNGYGSRVTRQSGTAKMSVAESRENAPHFPLPSYCCVSSGTWRVVPYRFAKRQRVGPSTAPRTSRRTASEGGPYKCRTHERIP